MDGYELPDNLKNDYTLSNGPMTRFNEIANDDYTEIYESLINNISRSFSYDMLGRALLRASAEGNNNFVELLIWRGGININYAGTHGETALMEAVKYGHMGTVGLLYEYNGDIYAKNDIGETILMIARHYYSKSESFVELIISQGVSVDTKDKNGQTALMKAASDNSKDSIKFAKKLTELGAYVNAQDDNGNTALIIAGKCGNVEMFRLLVESRADIDIKNNKGETALTVITNQSKNLQARENKDHYQIIKMILDKA